MLRYLQPQLSALEQHGGAEMLHESMSGLQVYFVRNPQAISEPISWPIGHHTDRRVSKLWDALGRNSRKSALKKSALPTLSMTTGLTPSTGRFPPTPNPNAAYSPQVPTQLGPPPIARPNKPARNRVVLKAKRRPIRSEPTPQKEAPKHSPVKRAQVVYRTLLELTPNSDVKLGKVSATTWSLSQYSLKAFWLLGAYLKHQAMHISSQ